jgi:2-keto-4-pentenoate hydratase/2-oxohepta-3-ene-1,7-dioic acid hydratase in catechol pathway
MLQGGYRAEMRLVTFREQAVERIGIQLDTGILDLSQAAPGLPNNMIDFLTLGAGALTCANEACLSPHDRWLIKEKEVELSAPIPHPGKVLCMGHNYHGHIGIGNTELPEYPNLFCKTPNTIIGPGQAIAIPPISCEVDFEAEFMAVIGMRAHQVTQLEAEACIAGYQLEAEACIAGYTIFNDVSARDYQKRTSQWMLGKSFNTFGPMGPALVTVDEIPDPYDLELELTVNGIPQQRTNTRDLIFTVPYLIAYISQVMTLEPGDVIATGTPAKLAEASTQKRYLQPGDVVEITIDKLGKLSSPVISL